MYLSSSTFKVDKDFVEFIQGSETLVIFLLVETLIFFLSY